MTKIIIRILITAIAVMLSAKVVPGLQVRSISGAIGFAIALGLLNYFLFWLLVILSLPAVALTLGAFVLVINALLFWMADKFVGGVQVNGFMAAFLGSLLTSGITTIAYWVLPETE